jgi:hypothetical protein
VERRYNLSLDFFNPRVFFINDDNTLLSGAQYILKGPRVAHLTHGPLGHPGDGEYDHWYFSEILFSIRFVLNELVIALEGTSEPSLFYTRAPRPQDETKSLPSQTVQVSAVVPRSKMRAVLQMSDDSWKHFQLQIDRLWQKEQSLAHMPS